MKKILIYTLALASLLAVSCQRDAYEPGTPDREDCYNVYFPEQEFSGTIEITPEEGYDFQIELKREKTEGNISVPLKAVCGANPDVVAITTAEFADGEDAATATLSFKNPELMKEYRIILSIVGDEYAPKYSQSLAIQPSTLSVDVTYAKWNSVAQGKYFAGLFPATLPAILYQNDTFPELFRIYTGVLNNIEFTGDKVTPDEGSPYYLLSIPEQATGQTYGQYGDIYISDYFSYTGSKQYCSSTVMTEDYKLTAVVVYYVSAGNLGVFMDTFTPNN